MKKLSLLLLILLAPTCLLAAKPGTEDPAVTRYTILLAGNKAGYETAATNADGSLIFHSEFNDRGRGPKIDEHIVLGKDGTPAQLESKGNDYYKAPVDEQFQITNGKAAWKSRSEQGEKQLSGSAFYVSSSGAVQETGILARALLASTGHRMALLPEGEASIEKLGELKIT